MALRALFKIVRGQRVLKRAWQGKQEHDGIHLQNIWPALAQENGFLKFGLLV